MLNDYNQIANIYAKHGNDGTAYLAFKYVPQIIEKFSNGKITLDYGCGSGTSTRFLKDIGLDVLGVDINSAMLQEAKSQNDGIVYQTIKSGVLPYRDNLFNMIFSSFVLFEISTKTEMLAVFKEIHRVLKKDGVFIAITGSSDMYKYPWLSLGVDFIENKNLISGSLAKILLKEINLVIYDYYWTDKDYLNVINNSSFFLLDKKFPLGDENDPYHWITETEKSPYVIYILKK